MSTSTSELSYNILDLDRIELLQHLKDNYLKSDNLNIAEIGVLGGQYSKEIRRVFPNANLYLIDVWDVYRGNDYFKSVRGTVVISGYNSVKTIFKDDAKCNIIKGRSEIECKQFKSDFFDMVYLDAEHNYESVLRDINDWYPKVKYGGILSGHDWTSDPSFIKAHMFGVDRAVLDFLKDDVKKLNLTKELHNKSWFFQKK